MPRKTTRGLTKGKRYYVSGRGLGEIKHATKTKVRMAYDNAMLEEELKFPCDRTFTPEKTYQAKLLRGAKAKIPSTLLVHYKDKDTGGYGFRLCNHEDGPTIALELSLVGHSDVHYYNYEGYDGHYIPENEVRV